MLALAFLVLEQYPSWYPLSRRAMLFVAFVGYSLIALSLRELENSRSALLRLVLDLIFFFICAADAPDHGAWLSALLYLYILTTAVLYHEYREVAVVFGLSLAFFLFAARDQAVGLWPALVVGGVLALLLSYQRRLLQERLATASRQAVMFRSEAEKARESERQRIAADFHDGPLQSFISFQMRLEIIRKLLDRKPAMALEELRQLQQLVRTQIADLRSFVRSMRLADVEGASLSTAIRQIADDFQKTSGLTVTLMCGEEIGSAEPDVSREILQIVREALHNAQKHSNGSRVALALERRGDVLEINVNDDGAGFPFGGAYSLEELEQLRMGPGSIKRRVRNLNGELVVDSKPGRGATLRIRIAI